MEKVSLTVLCFVFLTVAFLSLLQQLGTAYSLSQSYSLKEALKKYDALPDHHYRTGWVLAEVGKAHLELSEYTKVWL